MRHQRSALQLASSVVDFHVLNISDVVRDVRQELEKRAELVEGVDGAMDLASRVRIHRAFMPPVVQRAMDAGGPPRALGHYVSVERIRHAVEEFRGLQERLRQFEETVKQFSDGAAEGRLICADVGCVRTWLVLLSLIHYFSRLLDAAVALELTSQSLLGKIAEVTSAFDGNFHLPSVSEAFTYFYQAPIVNVEPIMQGKTEPFIRLNVV